MRLRCFFGPMHGKWIEVRDPLTCDGIFGGHYQCVELVITYGDARMPNRATRWVLIAEGHKVSEVMDWLFTYQPDHPQHPDDPNHPRELAKRHPQGMRTDTPDSSRW